MTEFNSFCKWAEIHKNNDDIDLISLDTLKTWCDEYMESRLLDFVYENTPHEQDCGLCILVKSCKK